MPYDFTVAKTALSRASNIDGWADKKSAQLQADFLLSLQQDTLFVEALADEIALFILSIEDKINEITNYY